MGAHSCWACSVAKQFAPWVVKRTSSPKSQVDSPGCDQDKSNCFQYVHSTPSQGHLPCKKHTYFKPPSGASTCRPSAQIELGGLFWAAISSRLGVPLLAARDIRTRGWPATIGVPGGCLPRGPRWTLGRCVLLCFIIKPILGNRYGPGVIP